MAFRRAALRPMRRKSSRFGLILAMILLLAAVSLYARSSLHPAASQQVAPSIATARVPREDQALVYVGQFSSDKDVKQSLTRSQRAVNIFSGRGRDSTKNSMAHPEHIAVDSAGRVIVTDPPAKAVHIFDFENNKYSRIEDWHRIP